MTAADRSVLLVDDDEMIRVLVEQVLVSDLGIAVRAARDTHEAVEATQTAPPDLILLDLHLPGPDGFDLLRWLKANARTANIPVLAFTAASGEIVLRAVEAGCISCLRKPFDLDDLVAIVRKHVDVSAADAN